MFVNSAVRSMFVNKTGTQFTANQGNRGVEYVNSLNHKRSGYKNSRNRIKMYKNVKKN